MGRRWAWMGMVGVCALLTGCQKRESGEQTGPVAARAPAPSRPANGPAPERVRAAPPAATPEQQAATGAPGQTAPDTQARAAPANTGPVASGTPAQPAPAAPGTGTAAPGAATARTGRVMIGLEAVQAREDEAWYEGAARAAQAFQEGQSKPLDQVVIATGTVDGRVTRVGQGTLHVRDGEGNVYQLRIDKRSRGLREGQPVPLRQLEEGTPVRASFDLVGESSIARDIEVRR